MNVNKLIRYRMKCLRIEPFVVGVLLHCIDFNRSAIDFVICLYIYIYMRREKRQTSCQTKNNYFSSLAYESSKRIAKSIKVVELFERMSVLLLSLHINITTRRCRLFLLSLLSMFLASDIVAVK
jgi:hypothetical protein